MELSAHELNVDGELDYDDEDDQNDENDNDDDEYCYEDENQLYCVTCDRHFSNHYSFKKHTSEHRICGIDECTFAAHEKVIEKHIIMQHTTGLYDKIRNISTPEDIAKWIADRKRNYPTKENIDKRRQKQEEMLKRGEKIQRNKDRFGRKGKTRLQKPNKEFPKTTLIKSNRKRKANFWRKQSLINERCNWNGNLFPFRGTRELYTPEEKNEESEFNDDEWIEDSKPKSLGAKLHLNNALGALMGAYNSSDESDLDIKTNVCNNITSDIIKAANNEDDEGPDEKKIARLPPEQLEHENKFECSNSQFQSDRCTRKSKRKRAKHRACGNNKKRRHDDQQTVKNQATSIENKVGCSITRKFKKRRATLLEKLLESEIRHERNVLLQCVNFVVSNNFLRTIESN